MLVLSIGLSLFSAAPATAAPATSVSYPARAAGTTFSGKAFDTCTAPSLKTMRAWRSSQYRAAAIYIGGMTRGCTQRHLSADWVRQVTAMRWRLIPIYTGRQAPCRNIGKKYRISVNKARAQGVAAAKHAVGKSKALGLQPGSAVYLDIETYPAAKKKCRAAVLRFVSGWTKGLHKRGYLSGVYASLFSGGRHLAEAYRSGSLARPDAVWIAHWNKKTSLKNWPGIHNGHWAAAQRGKQYRGPHAEKHRGRKLHVDSNRFRAPVATVGYRYRVTSGVPLKGREGPSKKHQVVTTFAPGSRVSVVCQTRGAKAAGTRVWNKLTKGVYVSGAHLSTPSKKRFSAPLPRCGYPYQITAPDGLNKRTGPGTSYDTAGRLPPGSLVRVTCQRKGKNIFGNRVWNKLHDGTWVSDYYVATPGKGFTKPIRRC